jgi:DNA polymerase III subunit delta'
MAFADLIGHDGLKGVLSEALRRRRLPPALLFVGPDGVGKKGLALTAARALVCEGGTGDTCEACAPCRRSARGLHPDVIVIEPDGATIKIEAVRDAVREIAGRPFEGRARGFVFDQAHLLTEQASNALLKSLEEPPATSHVLLVTAAPQALLPTIRSRCQTLRVRPLPAALIEEHLRAHHGADPQDARLRAVLSGGSLGAALAFQPEAYRGMRDELLGLLERLPTLSPLDRMEAAERLADADDVALVLTALRSVLRDLAVLRVAPREEAALNRDVVPRLSALAQGPLGLRAGPLAEAVGETREALRVNANKLIAMDVLLDVLAAPALV